MEGMSGRESRLGCHVDNRTEIEMLRSAKRLVHPESTPPDLERPDVEPPSVGDALHAFIETAGLTASEFGVRVGWDASYTNDVLAGRAWLRDTDAKILSDVMGTAAVILFDLQRELMEHNRRQPFRKKVF